MLNRKILFTLQLILLVGGCRSLPRAMRPPGEGPHALSIMQGVTSASTTRFSVMVPRGERLAYFVRDAGVDRPLEARRFTGPATEFAVDHLSADHLKPNVTYELIVTRDGEVRDRRRFKALDVAKAHARVAVISCMDDTMLNEAREMWPQVLSQAPDALLLIGDNVYADHVAPGPNWKKPGPADLWRRYVETRNDLPLYHADPLVPVVATWDDHDFAHDNADGTYPYREQSRETFFACFPQAEPAEGFSRGPGVASWWRVFGVEWALTDDRYFRTPNKVDSPAQSHFGSEQERWLITNLTRAERPVMLTSGDQFFGAYHAFESYEGSHPRSFAHALAEWRRVTRPPILFLSGDRHLTEIMNVPAAALGYPTFEVTSSGIHSSTFADAFKRAPSPHQVVGVAGQLNYSILEFLRTDPGLLRVSVQSFGPARRLLYQRTLTVKPR